MAMSYTSLVADKSTPGSIASWVNYTKLSTPDVILEESQALLFQTLRLREMVSTLRFTMLYGMASWGLADNFLDPIGRMLDTSQSGDLVHADDGLILERRSYGEESDMFGVNPIATVNGSKVLTFALVNHDFSQDSTIYISGAAAVGGIDPNGTYVIASITQNTFTVISETVASSTATGGGASVSYTIQNLYTGSPWGWAIINDRIIFDTAFSEQRTLMLRYYRRPDYLSETIQTNFITKRYPHLLRAACLAGAADFMKDDGEYQRAMTRLGTLVDRAMVETDYSLRGAEIITETP